MRRHCGRMRHSKALPLIVVLTTFFSCIGMSETVQSTLKLQVMSGLPIVDGVYLNGQGPFRFLIDTGEQANEMDPALARKLGLVATLQRDLATPGGNSVVKGGKVGKVLLGPAQVDELEFLFVERDGIRNLDPDIRGTLGQQFLAQFDYTLDFKHHRMTIGDGAPVGTRVAFRLNYGCMVVPTDQGELMLDSGTDTVFFFKASPHAAVASMATSNANMAIAVDRVPALAIGGREYHPGTAAFHPVADAPAAGLLPASLFRSIFVSNSGHFVVFDPEGGQ
jgi:hypothetical protein